MRAMAWPACSSVCCFALLGFIIAFLGRIRHAAKKCCCFVRLLGCGNRSSASASRSPDRAPCRHEVVISNQTSKNHNTNFKNNLCITGVTRKTNTSLLQRAMESTPCRSNCPMQQRCRFRPDLQACRLPILPVRGQSSFERWS